MAFLNSKPVSIVEAKAFTDDAQTLLTEEELANLQTTLAYTPEIGVRIPGTGGLRKLRIGIEQHSKGKRGGARVVYYYHSEDIPIALLAIFAKGEKIDLTPDDKKELKAVMKQFIAQYYKA